MILSNRTEYDLLYEKYESEFEIGKKTFSQMFDWISSNYDFIEVPVQSMGPMCIDIFRKNCENISGNVIASTDSIKAFLLVASERKQIEKEYWFIVETNTCYMESNCLSFDVAYHITLGIDANNILKYTDALIIYLNYFRTRDELSKELWKDESIYNQQ